jgi:hypothetical protein
LELEIHARIGFSPVLNIPNFLPFLPPQSKFMIGQKKRKPKTGKNGMVSLGDD